MRIPTETVFWIHQKPRHNRADGGGGQGFLAYFDRTPELNAKYKIYIFSYLSNRENLFWLAVSMGKRMDSFIQNGWMRDSKMVMLAYSMGGLISRLYLNNITVHEGQYNGQKAGERVLRLITPRDATPWVPNL